MELLKTPDRTRIMFDHCGIAALSDLKTGCWRRLFELLESEQAEFRAAEDQFRSAEYKWPCDPLHTWSRVWEYPYVYHHLRQWIGAEGDDALPRVVDFGSGVTFFPFCIAKLGCHVTCVDVDPVVSADLPKAAEVVKHDPGRVDCRLCGDGQLPFDDREIDAVYCISVLEHIPHFEETIAEIARILKPGGLFVLTIDLDLRGDQAIGVTGYQRLTQTLHSHFEVSQPLRTVHPADMLRSCDSPFSSPTPNVVKYLVRESLRRVLGRSARRRIPFDLAVEGLVFERK